MIALRKMRSLGFRKSLYLPFTAFFIILICFFQYHNSGVQVEKGVKLSSTYHSQKQELSQVLRRATMADRSVILTMVNESWARPGSILEVFLQSFKSGIGTHRLLNHLVIIAMDIQAYNYCKSLHSHCIHPSTLAYVSATKKEYIMNPNHNITSKRRINFLLQVLQLGYSIIFTDADILWLRNPFPKFSPSNHELSISCNYSRVDANGKGRVINVEDGGIFFLKSNTLSVEFFKYLKLNTVLYPNSYASESFCTTLMENEDAIVAYGVRIKYVETASFGGFCKLSNEMLKNAYTIHANCCGNLTSKVHDMKNVLDDWNNMREHASKDNTSYKNALRWPQKCIRQKST
ncbi:PREDICTED: uncharacterized protein At4g15970-like isoform X1 [Lupinus angustifolius]|uniref:uncharacterized protein At4g15970-like isoform X1 n=1 Tax=Lupinus angustifolius TaxID=3871 RepID=UPI00092FC292|nr:PREDICTED: uncharacterized protein At4g15970-like isoform X1 [Lupinus angustifolius]